MKTNITLFTTHCPKCRVLTAKLDAAGVSYDMVEDIEAMQQLGIDEVPCLRINEDIINFSDAVKWVNSLHRGA